MSCGKKRGRAGHEAPVEAGPRIEHCNKKQKHCNANSNSNGALLTVQQPGSLCRIANNIQLKKALCLADSYAAERQKQEGKKKKKREKQRKHALPGSTSEHVKSSNTTVDNRGRKLTSTNPGTTQHALHLVPNDSKEVRPSDTSNAKLSKRRRQRERRQRRALQLEAEQTPRPAVTAIETRIKQLDSEYQNRNLKACPPAPHVRTQVAQTTKTLLRAKSTITPSAQLALDRQGLEHAKELSKAGARSWTCLPTTSIGCAQASSLSKPQLPIDNSITPAAQRASDLVGLKQAKCLSLAGAQKHRSLQDTTCKNMPEVTDSHLLPTPRYGFFADLVGDTSALEAPVSVSWFTAKDVLGNPYCAEDTLRGLLTTLVFNVDDATAADAFVGAFSYKLHAQPDTPLNKPLPEELEKTKQLSERASGHLSLVADGPKVARLPDPPTQIELCDEQKDLVDLVLTGHNVFYTGSAGTGKSTVLHAFFERLISQGKRVEKLAPTGLTALNIGGQTYFRFADWKPDSKKRHLDVFKNQARSGRQYRRMNEADVIIIDEISMLEAHQLERLDAAFRAARQPGRCGCQCPPHEKSCKVIAEWFDTGYGSRNSRSPHDPELPFGGVQVVITGDFNQLPPVKPFSTCFPCGRETKPQNSNRGPWTCDQCPNKTFYLDDRWAFQSDAWKSCNFVNVNLTEIHRQADPDFVAILETVRNSGDLSPDQIALLLDHPCDIEGAVHLFPRNRKADKCNAENLAKIKRTPRFFFCYDNRMEGGEHHQACSGKRSARKLKALKDHRFAESLELKVGMRVMYLVNSPDDPEIVNGSQGEVVGFLPYKPTALNDRRCLNATSVPLASGEHAGYRNLSVRNWITQSLVHEWPIVRFLNGKKKVIHPVCEVKEIGNKQPFTLQSRTQLPLVPAWAITIHKSQGMSLDRVKMDLDDSFEPEMTYVALSRARSLQGLKITSHDGLAVLQGRNGRDNCAVREFLEGCFGKPKGHTKALHADIVRLP